MDLFVDNAGNQLLASAGALTPLSALRWGQLIDTVNVWLLDRPANAGAAMIPNFIPAGFSDIVIAGRPANNLEGASDLFECSGFVQVGAGNSLHYAATMNLNTVALNAALTGQQSLDVLIDVWLQNADGTARRPLIMQQAALIIRPIYRGTEPAPVAGPLGYALPQYLLTYMPSITGLTGGGAANLDGQPTLGGASPKLLLTETQPLDEWKLVPSPTIVSASVANPTVITTAKPHGLVAGQSVVLGGVAGATPALNGAQVVASVPSPTTFTVAENVTVAGAGGTVTPDTNAGAGIVVPADFDPVTNAQYWISR